MEQALSIWSPVIVSELKVKKKYHKQSSFKLGRIFQAIDELKIKIKKMEVKVQGRAVEAMVMMDILSLLEDNDGQMQLLRKEETVRDRVELIDFNNDLVNIEMLDFIIDIDHFNWEGELSGSNLEVYYFFEYMLMAIKNQVVELNLANKIENHNEIMPERITGMEEEIETLKEENLGLKNKMFYYEKNFSNLKRAIYKSEKINASLNRELKEYEEKLLKAKKDFINIPLSTLRNKQDSLKIAQNTQQEKDLEEGIYNLGNRIKKMFLNE